MPESDARGEGLSSQSGPGRVCPGTRDFVGRVERGKVRLSQIDSLLNRHDSRQFKGTDDRVQTGRDVTADDMDRISSSRRVARRRSLEPCRNSSETGRCPSATSGNSMGKWMKTS